MHETPGEITALQQLLDRSHASATAHLRGIIDDQRTLTAQEIVSLMTDMRVLSVATVTASAEPRVSALDGHFLHARWIFSTSGSAAKARQLRARPAVSVACIEGEELAVFTHGHVDFIEPETDDFAGVVEYLTAHYGSSPLSWGEDIVLCRVQPTWTVGYAFKKAEVLQRRGVHLSTGP